MGTLTKCASLHVRKSILIKQLRPLWSRFIVTIMYLTDGRHLLQDFLICLHQSFFSFPFLQMKVHRNYVPLLNECLSRQGWTLWRDWFLLAIWKVYGHRMFDFFFFFLLLKRLKAERTNSSLHLSTHCDVGGLGFSSQESGLRLKVWLGKSPNFKTDSYYISS